MQRILLITVFNGFKTREINKKGYTVKGLYQVNIEKKNFKLRRPFCSP